jgi:maltose alpha-D-glucosyltransferase/alpha-amylase
MGDNIYLGDRNGVRTPMQWNSDRNAGFSKCDPARLYFPVVMDPIYGYQVVNVEAQLSDQSSLLHWTRNMIALRRLFQVFGRGTLEFLHPENRKVLAYLRNLKRDDGTFETVLCVANLSRFAQPVSLDLQEYAGAMPVEMLGYVSFPQIMQAPYPLTVAPYSFLWFELQPAPVTVTQPEDTSVSAEATEIGLDLESRGWVALATGEGLALLESSLPAWLGRQRWFGAKSRTIRSVSVVDWAQIPLADDALGAGLFFIEVQYAEGESDVYQVPLAVSSGRGLEAVSGAAANSIVANLALTKGPAALHDATVRDDCRQSLLRMIEEQSSVALKATDTAAEAFVVGTRSSRFAEVRGVGAMPSRVSSAEQSNTSLIYDQSMIMKLFRRLQPGENPDIEIGRFLTEVAKFQRIAPFLGEITRRPADGEPVAIAMLQELVANEGDGWQWTLEELARFYESVATCPPPADEGRIATLSGDAYVPAEAKERAGLYLEAAALLGRRTAEMHLALATETKDEEFGAEPFGADDLLIDARRIDAQINRTLDALRARMSTLKDETADDAATILSRRIELFARAHAIGVASATGKRIRIHGDYHLGQVLRAKNDFVLLDFEGEPARALDERRRKQCPLKDVAGMLRSFSYAAWSGLDNYAQRHPDSGKALEGWARFWQNAVSNAFLNAYRETIAVQPELLPESAQAEALLNAYVLEKALYELLYELNNRPAWVRIPLAGILALPKPSAAELRR